MKVIRLLLILAVIALLVSGCGKRMKPNRQIQIQDEITQMEEPLDEEILEDDSDLDLDVEIIDDTSSDDDPLPVDDTDDDESKSKINFDGLDLDLEESVDEELPDDDIEALE